MFIQENQSFIHIDDSAQIVEVKTPVTPKKKATKEASQVSKTGSNGMIIRGMTFYKSEPDPMVADDGEPGENCKYKPSFSFKLVGKIKRKVPDSRQGYLTKSVN